MAAMSTSARVPGHGLQDEGRVRGGGYVDNSHGVGRCSCGEKSPELPNTAARKRWHREHKAAVIEAGYAVERDAS